MKEWIQQRRVTLTLSLFFLGWYGLQLSVLYLFGSDSARWWFYFEKPLTTVTPGTLLSQISHDMHNPFHISHNVLILVIAGGLIEPHIGAKKLLFITVGLGYLGTYLANLTVLIHDLWMVAGASGGIFSLSAYAGLRLRHKAYECWSGLKFSQGIVEPIIAATLLLSIPVFFLHEAVLAERFHSGHVFGILLGWTYFAYEYYTETV